MDSASKRVVAIDTETNAKDIRDGRGFALGASICFRSPETQELDAFYLPFRHTRGNYSLDNFKKVLQSIVQNHVVCYHNAKFDIESLRTLGIDAYPHHFLDTMLLVHLIDENILSHTLEYVSRKYLSDGGKKMKGTELEQWIRKYGWAAAPSWMMAEYATYDAYLTFKLGEILWPKVVKEDLVGTWQHKQDVVRLVIDMERNGVAIDNDLCYRMIAEGEKAMVDLLSKLGGLNPSSQKDLPKLFLDKLGLPEIYNKKTGRRTFDKAAMARYETILESRGGDPTAQLVLAYRGWQKSVSSNYRPYIELQSPDGRLRPNYLIHGTRTGRFSCEKPNLQQIPKEGNKPWNGIMKKCFVPAPGYVLLEADYSQLELRLGAAAAKVDSLIEIFNNPDRDVFTEISKQIGRSRQDTKTLIYSLQYGAGTNRLMDVFGVNQRGAMEILADYYSKYPNFRKATEIAKRKVTSQGYIRLWSGRVRHFANPSSESYKAFNSYVQGGAADIVERTMLRCKNEYGLNDGEKCRMLLQVHDSVVFEVREDLEKEYKAIIKKAMEEVTPDLGVYFKTDVHHFGAE